LHASTLHAVCTSFWGCNSLVYNRIWRRHNAILSWGCGHVNASWKEEPFVILRGFCDLRQPDARIVLQSGDNHLIC